jgi:hypothetical protein
MKIDFKKPSQWNMDRWLRFIAGVVLLIVTLVGVIPADDVHPLVKIFLLFMAVNQIQSAFTNWCPVMDFLRAFKIKECGE